MTPGRKRLFILTTALGCFWAPGAGDPGAAPSPPESACVETVPCQDPRGCPDLVVDAKKLARRISVETIEFASDSCSVLEGEVGGAGARRLLVFTTNTPNLGPGDLVIGDPLDHPEWFSFDNCHGHAHFREYSDYRLWTPDGYTQWAALRAQNPAACAADLLESHPEIAARMVAGHKQGFCIVDLYPSKVKCPYPADPFKYDLCETIEFEGVTYKGNQGISVCWADEYYPGLSGQWIDITGLPAGKYVLEVEVNAERFFAEAAYGNNSSAVSINLRR